MQKDSLVLTASETSKVLRISNARTLDMLESGEIPAYRDGTDWKVPVSLLNSYIENKAINQTKERRKLHEAVGGENESKDNYY